MSGNFITIILVTILFWGFCCLIYFGYNTWQESKESAYTSCISSVSNEMHKIEAIKDLILVSNDWKILSEKEIDFLMTKIHGGDCGKYNNQTLDIWERKINMALRKPADRVEIIIWSNGRDGISGTKDDLVIP